jgi:hypothetical protein
VANDNTVRFENLTFQIASQTFRYSLARCPVLVCRHLDHSFSVYYGQHLLGRYDPKGGQWISGVAIRQRKKQIA